MAGDGRDVTSGHGWSTSLAVRDTERRERGRTTALLAASRAEELQSATPPSQEQRAGLGETQNTGTTAQEGSSLKPRLYLNIEFGI